MRAVGTSHLRGCSVKLAGYPARLAEVPITLASGGVRSVRLWEVEDLERVVDRDALLREPGGIDPPYWALAWSGAHAVARALLSGRLLVGQDVLDLGTGLGLAGLAAALAGARVTFADLAPECAAFVEASARANGLPAPDFRRIDFTSDDLGRTFDVVLAADVVYEPAHHAALARFLDLHVAPSGHALLTDRLYAATDTFFARLTALGFVDERQECEAPEMGETMRTVLHRLSRGKAGPQPR